MTGEAVSLRVLQYELLRPIGDPITRRDAIGSSDSVADSKGVHIVGPAENAHGPSLRPGRRRSRRLPCGILQRYNGSGLQGESHVDFAAADLDPVGARGGKVRNVPNQAD